MVTELKACEVCGNRDLESVLNLGNHPLCDDLVPIGDSRICKEYPIEILFCPTCVTAQQRFRLPKEELFPPNYHYRARHTQDVLKGMEELVRWCESEIGSLEGLNVLDIGCNDGSLLNFFKVKGSLTYGVDPTKAANEAAIARHEVFPACYFHEEFARRVLPLIGTQDIITMTNVFAHVDNLPSVIEGIRLLSHNETMIVIENHYLGSVLDKCQFDTFYYEHLRTYSATSFLHIGKHLGIAPKYITFPSRYNGNIRVTFKNDRSPNFDDLVEGEKNFGRDLKTLADHIPEWKAHVLPRIEYQVKKHGRMRAKAFPGRAAILIKLLGLTNDQIEAAYEKPGSSKIGHYIPGTRIPILSEDLLEYDDDRPILNLAWHISHEIKEYLKEKGFRGEVTNIL